VGDGASFFRKNSLEKCKDISEHNVLNVLHLAALGAKRAPARIVIALPLELHGGMGSLFSIPHMALQRLATKIR